MPLQLSEAVAGGIVYVLLLTAQKVCAGGQAITGGVLSNTLMICETDDQLLHASVKVNVLVMV